MTEARPSPRLESEFRDDCLALYQALQQDAFYITLENSIDPGLDRREAMLHYLDFSMREAARYGLLFRPEDHRYGLSIWLKPQKQALATRQKNDKRQFLIERLGQHSFEVYQKIVAQMSANTEGLIDDDAWYLSIVGVLPAYQGRGLGPGLIQPVLQASDQAGVQTYLETFSPRNIAFYERLGYLSVATFFEPTTLAEYRVMRRPAGSGRVDEPDTP